MGKFDLDQFYTQPDPDLICPICQCVLEDAVECPCRHVFCRGCIEKWLENKDSCPSCRGELGADQLRQVLPMIQNMINRLAMKCTYMGNGCKKKIELEHFETHTADCGYMKIKCGHPRCQKLLLKKKVEGHEKRCGMREVKCELECQLMIPVKEQRRHQCLDALKERVTELQQRLDQSEALRQELLDRNVALEAHMKESEAALAEARNENNNNDGDLDDTNWDNWDDSDEDDDWGDGDEEEDGSSYVFDGYVDDYQDELTPVTSDNEQDNYADDFDDADPPDDNNDNQNEDNSNRSEGESETNLGYAVDGQVDSGAPHRTRASAGSTISPSGSSGYEGSSSMSFPDNTPEGVRDIGAETEVRESRRTSQKQPSETANSDSGSHTPHSYSNETERQSSDRVQGQPTQQPHQSDSPGNSTHNAVEDSHHQKHQWHSSRTRSDGARNTYDRSRGSNSDSSVDHHRSRSRSYNSDAVLDHPSRRYDSNSYYYYSDSSSGGEAHRSSYYSDASVNHDHHRSRSHSYYSDASVDRDHRDHSGSRSRSPSYYSDASVDRDRHRSRSRSASYYSDASVDRDRHRSRSCSPSYYSDASVVRDHRSSSRSPSYYSDASVDRDHHRSRSRSPSYYSDASVDRDHHRSRSHSPSYYSDDDVDRDHHRSRSRSPSYYSDDSVDRDRHRSRSHSRSYYSDASVDRDRHRSRSHSRSYYSDASVDRDHHRSRSRSYYSDDSRGSQSPGLRHHHGSGSGSWFSSPDCPSDYNPGPSEDQDSFEQRSPGAQFPNTHSNASNDHEDSRRICSSDSPQYSSDSRTDYAGGSEGQDNDSEGRDNDSEGRDNDSEGRDNDSEGQDNDSEGQDNDSEGQDNDSEGQDNDSEGQDYGSEEEGQDNESEGHSVEDEESFSTTRPNPTDFDHGEMQDSDMESWQDESERESDEHSPSQFSDHSYCSEQQSPLVPSISSPVNHGRPHGLSRLIDYQRFCQSLVADVPLAKSPRPTRVQRSPHLSPRAGCSTSDNQSSRSSTQTSETAAGTSGQAAMNHTYNLRACGSQQSQPGQKRRRPLDCEEETRKRHKTSEAADPSGASRFSTSSVSSRTRSSGSVVFSNVHMSGQSTSQMHWSFEVGVNLRSSHRTSDAQGDADGTETRGEHGEEHQPAARQSAASSPTPCVSRRRRRRRRATHRQRTAVTSAPPQIEGDPAARTYAELLETYAEESGNDNSDDTYEPPSVESPDVSVSEVSEDETGYPVHVPKTAAQLLDEYQSGDSDGSWEPT